jgi:hypothetical protein
MELVSMQTTLEEIGFEGGELSFSAGIIGAYADAGSYLIGNEETMKAEIKKQNANIAPIYARYQTPDQAKIIGAKAVVAANEVLQNIKKTISNFKSGQGIRDFPKTLSTWGRFRLSFNKRFRPEIYNAIIAEKYKGSCKKQIAEGILGLCESKELAIACQEKGIGGNSSESTREFCTLQAGPATALKFTTTGKEGEFTASSLEYCRSQYGKKWVRRAVESLYKNSPKDRENLSQAYEQFCRNNNISGRGSKSLENLLFGKELRKLCNERKKLIRDALKNPIAEKGDAGWDNAAATVDGRLESKWQAWLEKHTETHSNGSQTIDAGHIRIMVNSEQKGSLKLTKVVDCL